MCLSLLRKTKKQYNANWNEKDVADNKTFWKTVISLLSDKFKSNENITLVENDKIFTQDIKVAEELNSFFSSVVKNLKISEYKPLSRRDSKSNLIICTKIWQTPKCCCN